jgi:hypothetical protein
MHSTLNPGASAAKSDSFLQHLAPSTFLTTRGQMKNGIGRKNRIELDFSAKLLNLLSKMHLPLLLRGEQPASSQKLNAKILR